MPIYGPLSYVILESVGTFLGTFVGHWTIFCNSREYMYLHNYKVLIFIHFQLYNYVWAKKMFKMYEKECFKFEAQHSVCMPKNRILGIILEIILCIKKKIWFLLFLLVDLKRWTVQNCMLKLNVIKLWRLKTAKNAF